MLGAWSTVCDEKPPAGCSGERILCVLQLRSQTSKIFLDIRISRILKWQEAGAVGVAAAAEPALLVSARRRRSTWPGSVRFHSLPRVEAREQPPFTPSNLFVSCIFDCSGAGPTGRKNAQRRRGVGGRGGADRADRPRTRHKQTEELAGAGESPTSALDVECHAPPELNAILAAALPELERGDDASQRFRGGFRGGRGGYVPSTFHL